MEDSLYEWNSNRIVNDTYNSCSLMLRKPKALSLPSTNKITSITHYSQHLHSNDEDRKQTDKTNRIGLDSGSKNQNEYIQDNEFIDTDPDKNHVFSPRKENEEETTDQANLRETNEGLHDMNVLNNQEMREGKTVAQMISAMDKVLDEMYSIQIRNAILMDRLVMMGSDL